MKIQGFASSLAFAALLAVSVVFVLELLEPWVGRRAALMLHLSGGLVAYAALLAPTARAALRNAFAAGLGLAALMLIVDGPDAIALGATALLALVRTGLSSEGRSLRRWGTEILLGIGSLGFAGWLGSSAPLGLAAALWGYGLVQALYFLVPGAGRRPESEEDPFDRASGRLAWLLDQE